MIATLPSRLLRGDRSIVIIRCSQQATLTARHRFVLDCPFSARKGTMTGLLQGKVALITGAAHGIGAGVARQFVRQGARVLVTDVLDDEARARVDELNRDAGDSLARFTHLDVTREPDWRVAVVLAEQAFGKLDTLINVAGVPGRAGIEQMTEPDWDRTVDTDLKGTW